MQLSQSQTEAVNYIQGPCIISAGPGSGKTYTITHKFANLVINHGINPNRILCITFTNKSSEELKLRVCDLLQIHTNPYWVRTIHSACLQLVKPYIHTLGYDSNFTIATGSKSRSIIKTVLNDLRITTKDGNIGKMLQMVSRSKDYPNPVKHIQEKFATVPQAREIYVRYQEILQENNFLDFDDILHHVYFLFKHNEQFRNETKSMFDYILVDEYQDVNNIQYLIIKQLGANITVVGDDYQCWHEDCKIRTDAGITTVKDIIVGTNSATIKGKELKVSPITNKSDVLKKKTFKITTLSGKSTIISWDHKCFVTQPNFTTGFYTYIMYREDKGFRIGVTSAGQTQHLRDRAQFERSERMWILNRHEFKVDAVFEEESLSLKYQIPKLPFYHNGHDLTFDQNHLDKIFNLYGQNGWKLFNDELLVFDYPNYIPQGTTRHSQQKININLIMNHTRGGFYVTYEHLGRQDSKLRMNYIDARQLAEQMKLKYDANIIFEKYHFKDREYLNVVPTIQVTVGMKIPVVMYDSEKNQYYEALDEIINIEVHGENDNVYHVEVAESGILITDDIITHNSIYAFRGSDPKYFINFQENYENSHVIKLEENYRSIVGIVDLSQSIIDKNKNQLHKKCFSQLETKIKPKVVHFDNEYKEIEAIVAACKKYIAEGFNLDEIAILYRIKMASRIVEQEFNRHGIPHKIVNDVSFFERREIKDIMAYILFLYNFNDTLSFRRLVQNPKRGIGDKTVDGIFNAHGETFLEKINSSLATSSTTAMCKLQKLMTMLENAYSMNFKDVVNYIIKEIKYNDYIKSYADEFDYDDRLMNLKELIAMSQHYDTLGAFLEDCALIAPDDHVDDVQQIKLMTIHAAKGLEFKVVFVIGLEEGTLPHYRSLQEYKATHDDRFIEEERRLFYVACTRAANVLNISRCNNRGWMKGLKKSRFINELDSDTYNNFNMMKSKS